MEETYFTKADVEKIVKFTVKETLIELGVRNVELHNNRLEL